MQPKRMRVPLKMEAHFDPLGNVEPRRFKWETDAHEVETVRILEIQSRQERKRAGTKEISFICTAIMEEVQHMFEVTYGVEEHKWWLTVMLY